MDRSKKPAMILRTSLALVFAASLAAFTRSTATAANVSHQQASAAAGMITLTDQAGRTVTLETEVSACRSSNG